VNCRANNRNRDNHESYAQNNYLRRLSETQDISYNRFESLSTEIKCYKCKNFGDMAKYCRMTVPPRESQQDNNNHKQEPQRIWIRKHNQFNNEECTLALQVKHKKCGWYVESGFSKHMTSDEDRFLTLKKEIYGSISFGNDNSTRIIGRCTENWKQGYQGRNVLLVEDMKHNILSVIQMCDQGHKLVFDSQK
jgi:hypothetical protein